MHDGDSSNMTINIATKSWLREQAKSIEDALDKKHTANKAIKMLKSISDQATTEIHRLQNEAVPMWIAGRLDFDLEVRNLQERKTRVAADVETLSGVVKNFALVDADTFVFHEDSIALAKCALVDDYSFEGASYAAVIAAIDEGLDITNR